MFTEITPTRIFEETSTDLFSYAGKEYLVYSDRFSGWPTIFQFNQGETKTKQIIYALRKCFADLGVPIRLRTDGGPQFTSRDFKKFMATYGINHQLSTPYYPKGNSHAESAVKAMKHLLMKTNVNGNINTDEFQQGLIEWRNTPRYNGPSPAEIVFGQPMRTLTPAHKSTFDKRWHDVTDDIDNKILERKLISEKYYNHKTRKLLPLKIGDHIIVQNTIDKKWKTTGIIVAIGKYRDYMIKTPSGQLYWRNRKYLKKTLKSNEEMEEENEEQVPLRRSSRSHQLPDRLRY